MKNIWQCFQEALTVLRPFPYILCKLLLLSSLSNCTWQIKSQITQRRWPLSKNSSIIWQKDIIMNPLWDVKLKWYVHKNINCQWILAFLSIITSYVSKLHQNKNRSRKITSCTVIMDYRIEKYLFSLLWYLLPTLMIVAKSVHFFYFYFFWEREIYFQLSFSPSGWGCNLQWLYTYWRGSSC